MRRVRTLAPSCWLYIVLSCATLLACDDNAEPTAIPSAEHEDGDAPKDCKPACSAGCGQDDGCGGTCGCPSGQLCGPQDTCIASECGECDANELCVGGACVCSPSCAEPTDACKDDGCGGTCPCPDGYVQNADGDYVAPDKCHDTCAAAGWSCGTLCGQDCGECAKGEQCALGVCACEPTCDGTSCSDGCGGLCECAAGTVCNAVDQCVSPDECKDTCASTERDCGQICGRACGGCGDTESCVTGECVEASSCDDCALQFHLVGRKVIGGRIREVTLAIDYEPSANEPAPRVADLRIRTSRDATLVSLEEGAAITSSGKRLYVDETTNNPWRKHGDGSYQLLIYRATNTERLQPGQLVLATFELDELGPVEFSLVRRVQTFAPADADDALQSSAYERAVVVSQ